MGKKLFDYVIGNPPYQEEVANKGERANPIYDKFMESAFEISDVVELIHPARFLFNAGQTSKQWNKKMLQDEHFKVLHYEADATQIFPNTDIKGGVAITLRNANKSYEAIEVFTPYPKLNSILHKVKSDLKKSIKDIVVGGVAYKFAVQLKVDHPEFLKFISSSYDLRTNVFDNLDGMIFFEATPNDKDYVKIWGLANKKRSYRWILLKYIEVPNNFYKYKVVFPKSNGSGQFGEVLSNPFIGEKEVGYTQTFMSMGAFDAIFEAQSCLNYIKSKFARALLSVKKVTQDNPPAVWAYVPLQDFTSQSDIDWSKSIHEIDLQLYRKYGLDETEIDFIETHVKEMA